MSMSNQALSPNRVDFDFVRPPWWPSMRLGVEFALLFTAALLLTHWVLPGMSGTYPSPLWLPVIFLSLQYGLGAGVVAALLAVGLHFSDGLPPAAMAEDLYSYIGRIGGEPVALTCSALLIGHVRVRQIREKSELQEELAERSQHGAAVAHLCEDLRRRADMLERHIAANVQPSHIDIAEAIAGLHSATWDNFAERLTRFVNLMIGSAEFSLYLLRSNGLKLVFQPHDDNVLPADPIVGPDDGLFNAVVREGKTLLATRAADLALIGDRGMLFGPVLEVGSNRVVGMLGFGGADLADFPEDIERRIALAAAEISRFLNRVILIELPRGPESTMPRIQPIERLQHAHTIAQRLTTMKKNLDPAT
jgi:hypothetical protein